MKIVKIAIAVALLTVLAASPLSAKSNPLITAPIYTPLSIQETDTLVFMREEEKMARDVYLTLYDQWQVKVFTNIASSEQQHMDTMKVMLDRYAIEDPVVDDTVGVFVNSDLLILYENLVAGGSVGLTEALYAGALIEEIDIQDLVNAIAASTHTDLTQAYEALLKGSRNHLRAFVRNIEYTGLIYSAQYLEQDVVDEILDNPVERNDKSKGKKGKGCR